MATATLGSGGPRSRPASARWCVPTNLLTGIVLAAVGYYVGVQVGNGFGFNDQLNTGVLLGYAFGSILFLVGIGFAQLPAGAPVRLADRRRSLRRRVPGRRGATST